MQRYQLGSIAAAALLMSAASVQAQTAFARVNATGAVIAGSSQVTRVQNSGSGQYVVTLNNLNATRCAILVSAVHTVGFYSVISRRQVFIALRRNQDHVLENDEFSIGVQC